MPSLTLFAKYKPVLLNMPVTPGTTSCDHSK